MKRWDDTMKFERKQMRVARFWFFVCATITTACVGFAIVATGWLLAGFIAVFIVTSALGAAFYHYWHAAKFKVRLMERIQEAIARQPDDV